MKVIFLYLLAHFGTFEVKICYHGRKIFKGDYVKVVLPKLSVVRL